jgi:hypothetical protein
MASEISIPTPAAPKPQCQPISCPSVPTISGEMITPALMPR